MTEAQGLTDCAVHASSEQLSAQAKSQLKVRVLDSLECADGNHHEFWRNQYKENGHAVQEETINCFCSSLKNRSQIARCP